MSEVAPHSEIAAAIERIRSALAAASSLDLPLIARAVDGRRARRRRRSACELEVTVAGGPACVALQIMLRRGECHWPRRGERWRKPGWRPRRLRVAEGYLVPGPAPQRATNAAVDG